MDLYDKVFPEQSPLFAIAMGHVCPLKVKGGQCVWEEFSVNVSEYVCNLTWHYVVQ
jgi:hypothetical protein